jgi:flavin-dependent thymidylate synthase
MKVKLISVTPNALELLVGTKTTRMRGKSPEEMTQDELYDHFQYMLDTIKSPFEFVDYVFEITEVSKNFTHQLVRTRTGAYQQETSRALEVTETVRPEAFEYPDESTDSGSGKVLLAELFDDAVADAQAHYHQLLAAGAELQDARAVLPSNMATAIKAKFNLRTLSDMAKNRLCRRTQGEYQKVFRMMRDLVIAEHPWADPLLQVACVATGQCAFPRWGGKQVEDAAGFEVYQCDMYRPWMDLTKEKNELRKVFWLSEVINANPVAKDGKSM